MPKATGARCWICQNENRPAIDDVLCLRSAGEVLPNGMRPSLDWFLENCEGLWGLKTSRAAVARHVKRHIHFTGPGRQDKPVVSREADALAIRERMADVDDQDPMGTERYLRKLVAAGEVRAVVNPDGVTHQVALAAAAELRLRQLDDRKGLLMGVMAQALSPGEGISAERQARDRPRGRCRPQPDVPSRPHRGIEGAEVVGVDEIPQAGPGSPRRRPGGRLHVLNRCPRPNPTTPAVLSRFGPVGTVAATAREGQPECFGSGGPRMGNADRRLRGDEMSDAKEAERCGPLRGWQGQDCRWGTRPRRAGERRRRASEERPQGRQAGSRRRDARAGQAQKPSRSKPTRGPRIVTGPARPGWRRGRAARIASRSDPRGSYLASTMTCARRMRQRGGPDSRARDCGAGLGASILRREKSLRQCL